MDRRVLSVLEADLPDLSWVLVVEPHPHAGAFAQVQRPRNRKTGEPEDWFPGLVRLDLQGDGNCYAKPKSLLLMELGPKPAPRPVKPSVEERAPKARSQAPPPGPRQASLFGGPVTRSESLNGGKTRPLTAHALSVLRKMQAAPIVRAGMNPGVADRLTREPKPLAVECLHPSPFKKDKGNVRIHLEITAAGRLALEKAR